MSKPMKRFNIHLITAMLACMAAFPSHAATINVNVRSNKGNLTQELRQRCAHAAYGDTVVLNFAKGNYTIDGTIVLNTHVVIKGAGRGSTTITLDKGSDRNGYKAFLDDTFFKVAGTLKRPVTLSISDIAIKLKEHTGVWWAGERCFAVKVYHASRVDIRHVDSYMHNAICTNFDLQVCSNVTVTDCVISNYNNTTDGGNLWLRGEMHNINVKRNKFYKYGKDEAVGIFDRLVDNSTNSYVRGKASRTDIFVEDNEFHYKYDGKDKNMADNCYNHTVLSVMTDHSKSKDCCTTRNLHITRNKFIMTDMTARCMYISFDPADVHSGIFIEDNTIVNEAVGYDKRCYRQDIEVNDLSACGDTIRINGNRVSNKKLVLDPSGAQGYSFLLVQGGNVCMDGNKIVNEATVIPGSGKSTGVQLVWCGEQGGSVTMRNNVCKGIKCIAAIGAGNGTDKFTLNASNNYFAGDTRVYCHKVKRLDINFTGNTLVSGNMNFFLQEFAPTGTVVFNNNNVTVNGGNGQFMTHWSANSTRDYRFERLEVKNNVLHGVNSEQDLFINVTNVGKRTARANTITRQ